MKKVYIETMGCQMNKSDAERMYGMLEYCGYTQTENPKEADMLIVNTCSIRKLSEDKAYSQIGVWGKWRGSKINENGTRIYNDYPKIVFAGCVAQQYGKEVFKRAPYVDLVLGTQRLYELPNLVKRIESGERIVSCDEKPFEESDINEDVTGIKTNYKNGASEGTIAIIGPKRMEYSRVVTLLEYLKKQIEGKE